MGSMAGRLRRVTVVLVGGWFTLVARAGAFQLDWREARLEKQDLFPPVVSLLNCPLKRIWPWSQVFCRLVIILLEVVLHGIISHPEPVIVAALGQESRGCCVSELCHQVGGRVGW